MSKIKLFNTSFFYPDFLTQIYNQEPALKESSYDEQYKRLMSECFAWSDFWKLNLEKTGKYQVEETIINAEQLQKQWAKEHNAAFKQNNWQLDILEKQILKFQPDIFFAQDSKYITPDFRKRIKKICPSIKLIVGWDCIKLNDAQRFEGTDIMMSCLDSIADYYKQAGFTTIEFPFGFEPTILDRLQKRPPLYDFSFVGSLVLFMGGHFQRLRLLSKLKKNVDMDLWLAGTNPSLFHFLGYQVATIRRGKIADLFNQLSLYPAFRKLHAKSKGRAFGLEMYQILADSKITLNSHIDIAGNRAGNIRLWEATGAGTCLVTDWKENLNDIFEIDKEVVAYKSPEECVEKVKWLLDNEQERKAIAEAGHKKTLEHYGFGKRLNAFTNVAEKML